MKSIDLTIKDHFTKFIPTHFMVDSLCENFLPGEWQPINPTRDNFLKDKWEDLVESITKLPGGLVFVLYKRSFKDENDIEHFESCLYKGEIF